MTVSRPVRPLARAAVPALAVLAVAGMAAGCSSDVNPMKAAFVGAGYGPKEIQAPDFVAASRKADADFMPVGESAPRRAVRARSAEGQKTLQSELESARSRNEAKGRAAEGAARATGQGLAPPPLAQ